MYPVRLTVCRLQNWRQRRRRFRIHNNRKQDFHCHESRFLRLGGVHQSGGEPHFFVFFDIANNMAIGEKIVYQAKDRGRDSLEFCLLILLIFLLFNIFNKNRNLTIETFNEDICQQILLSYDIIKSCQGVLVPGG